MFSPNVCYLFDWKHFKFFWIRKCFGIDTSCFSSIAFSKSSGFFGSTNLHSMPISLNVFENKFHVPPYKSVELIKLSPAWQIFLNCKCRCGLPELTARPATPPSILEILDSKYGNCGVHNPCINIT